MVGLIAIFSILTWFASYCVYFLVIEIKDFLENQDKKDKKLSGLLIVLLVGCISLVLYLIAAVAGIGLNLMV